MWLKAAGGWQSGRRGSVNISQRRSERRASTRERAFEAETAAWAKALQWGGAGHVLEKERRPARLGWWRRGKQGQKRAEEFSRLGRFEDFFRE